MRNDKLANGFRLKVVASDGASLKDFYSLHACVRGKEKKLNEFTKSDKSYLLPVPQFSQFAFEVDFANRICSPTSCFSVLAYFEKDKDIDPVAFTNLVYDKNFDIYGNWVLNIAATSKYICSGKHNILLITWTSSVNRL